MSLLYLLVSEQASDVKVCISIDPRIRAAQLPASINLDQSLEIEFSGGSASPVERMLHYLSVSSARFHESLAEAWHGPSAS